MKFVYIVTVIALVFAVSRFVIPMPGIDLSLASVYKDFAHLFVGGLFGAAVLSWGISGLREPRTLMLLALDLGMTVVEVVAFFIHRQA